MTLLPRTGHELLNDALFRAGEPIDASSDFYAQSITELNRVYQSICSGGSELLPDANENWWFLRSTTPGVLTLQPAIIGNASVVNNSASVTLAVAPAVSMVGWFFMSQQSGSDIYRILTHTAATTAVTLDSVWTDSTNAALAIRSVKLEYNLPTDLHSIIDAMRGYRNGRYRVDSCELAELEESYPVATLQAGQPRRFAMVGEQRARFSHYPGDNATDLLRLEFDYKVVPVDLDDDDNEPIIPIQYRRVLSDYLTYFIFSDKSDDRATQVLNVAQATLLAMCKENRSRRMKMGDRFAKLEPRQDQINSLRRTPRSNSGFYFPS